MSRELEEALRYARLPLSVRALRLRDYGPTLSALGAELAKEGAPLMWDRLEAGRGWIIQGEPVRALQATQALLKAMLVVGLSGVFYSGFGPQMMEVSEDDKFAAFEDVKLVAIGRFYDAAYEHSPYTPRETFDCESFFMSRLGLCTPVLHCRGAFADCRWYSEDLTAALLNTCELVTV
jgi:hypothetical protein